jgi:hypothetical protein
MSRSLEVAAVCAIPAATVVLVLPGFALRAAPETLRKLGAPRWAVGRAAGEPVSEPRAAALVLALALSLCFAVGVGGTLLALGIFSPMLLALLSGLTALAGLVPFLRWCREGVRGLLLHVALVVALAVPISVSFFGGGYRPAQSYQWFYWGLGRQLSDANGVPDHVLEWGRAVRWQPDYLNFNLVSQAYIGLMRGVSEPMAVAAWRLPLAVGVLAMTFLVLRLWFTFLPAAVTTAALSATGLYIDKIGNNSPEALGITFGLVSVWLVVQAIRLRRRSWLMLGAVTIALTLSVHGIAATVLALLLIAAALVELVATRASPSRWVPALLVAAVTSGLVVASLGLALQGRTSPLGDAKRPAKIGALDPTYQFIQYSNGHFGTSVNHNSLRRLVTSPWRGVDLTSSSWWWLVALVAVGVVGALLLRPGRASRGVVTALVFGVLVAGAVAWFQLRYHTYVPQHTGNARIAQYAPLVYAFGLAAGLQVVVHLLTGLSSRRVGPGLRSGAAWVAAGVAILAFAPTTTQVMAGRPALPAVGVDALAELRSSAAPGSVVVSNVATRGTVEFFSGLENPLEGRQPLIEDLPTLTSATSYLRRMHEFLVDPHHGQLQQQLGASWLLLADSSGDLGTTLDYGTPAPHFARRSGLEVVWQQGGMSLLRVAGDVAPVASVGPHQVLWPKFLAALAVLLAGCAALALGLAWVDRRFAHRHRRDPTPAR